MRHVLWEVRFHQIFWAVILIIDAETEKVTYRLFCLLLIFVYSMKMWSISSSNYSKNDFKTFWLILVFTSWNLSERNRCINFSAGATKKKKKERKKSSSTVCGRWVKTIWELGIMKTICWPPVWIKVNTMAFWKVMLEYFIVPQRATLLN